MIPDLAGFLLCALILLWGTPVVVLIVAAEIAWWRQQVPAGRSWETCCLDSRDGLRCEHQRAAA